MSAEAAVLLAVGDELTRRRVALGYDVEAAAAAAGLPAERLALAEEGGTALCSADLEALAAAYGVEVSAFFGGRTTPLSYLAGG